MEDDMQGNAEQRQVPPLEIVERKSGAEDVFSALEDIAAHPARKWTAKAVPKDEDASEWVVSDKVAGVVDFIETREGDFGQYRAIELKTKDGSRLAVAGFGVVLGAWFRILRVGDGLAISYRGTKPASVTGHKDFDDFEVVVVRDGRRVSRDEPLGEYDEPLEDEGGGDGPE
jgi:hypothetical protein